MYDLAPIGYFTLSEDGRILEVNRAGCQLLGSTRGQLIRHRFTAFVEEDVVPFVQLLRRAFAGGQPCRLELGVVQSEGEKLDVQLDVRASSEGEQPYLRAAVTDITELKAAQAALANLNNTLEERIQARTAQIRELNEELETFVQTVTHNLQTPLRQFTSFAELLRRKGPVRDGQAQHYYDAMLGSVERMEGMVSALADYFQTGRQRPEMLSVDLERVLSDVRKELRPRLDGGTVTWQQDHLPTVTGDPRTLKQIFTALLDNALKFSAGRSQTEIHIVVRENESEYHIGVRDNGVGFNPRQQDRLFGIFQRLHSEREFSGLGTSLASVRRAVLRHGGRVWAEGNEGPGSCFWLALPRNVSPRR
ncbi:sensor histidine kinase [Deinococcus aerophilus]|uniref:sensor histidine kinase n=1 Tax=Deinococcus aerophilus TaxID=522488 RepID=UPI0027E5A283|nr:ATP-binding protein [Deinococcus aerophilus]